MGEPIDPNPFLDTTRLHRWLLYLAPLALSSTFEAKLRATTRLAHLGRLHCPAFILLWRLFAFLFRLGFALLGGGVLDFRIDLATYQDGGAGEVKPEH